MKGFSPGDEVRLVTDIVNDGTLFGRKRGECIQRRGDTGFIKKQGWFLDDLVVEVHFINTDLVIGCRDKELIPSSHPWQPPAFEQGQGVRARLGLTRAGVGLVAAGSLGQVQKRRFDLDLGYLYQVQFQGEADSYLLLETQLEGL